MNLREFDQIHRKNRQHEVIPKVGDIVMLQDQMPRSQWKMCRVEKLIPGKDGVVRAAKIKCKDSILQRSIQHLHPLEIHSDEESCNDATEHAGTDLSNAIDIHKVNPSRDSKKRVAALDAESKIRSLIK